MVNRWDTLTKSGMLIVPGFVVIADCFHHLKRLLLTAFQVKYR